MENLGNPGEATGTNASTPFRNALLGLTAIDQNLVLFDYGNVLVRRDYKSMNAVRLLSGGCPGRDLDYTDLVGKGMLTATVLGDQYISPCSRLILRTIRELTTDNTDGVIIISPANSEHFNFELAVERALADCLRVKLLIMEDMKSSCKYSPGFVLAAKIAGGMAEKQCLFHEISEVCDKICRQIRTIKIKSCKEETEAESYAKKVKIAELSCSGYDTTNISLDNVELNLLVDEPFVVLLTVPKDLQKYEEMTIVKEIVDRFNEIEVEIVRMYSGKFIKVPEREPHLTVLNVLDPVILDYLDVPCSALGWTSTDQSALLKITSQNEIQSCLKKRPKEPLQNKGPHLGDKGTRALEQSVQFACDALISCERQLNLIDAELSKGNVGTRLRQACEHVSKRLKNKKIVTDRPYTFLRTLAVIVEGGIGGRMGSIYGLLFESAASVFEKIPESDQIEPVVWREVLLTVMESFGTCCSIEAFTMTMYCPLNTLTHVVNDGFGKDPCRYMECFSAGVCAAEEAAQQTRRTQCRYSDAGAHAVGIWLRAIFEKVKLMYGTGDDFGD